MHGLKQQEQIIVITSILEIEKLFEVSVFREIKDMEKYS